jgi:LPS sulfotransferase NodH
LEGETYIKKATNYESLFSQLVGDYAINGVWGLKAHVQAMIPLFAIKEFPNHIRDWCFVYVTRDNIVRQAISQVIAELRESWMSWDEPTRELTDADYSHFRIARTIWLTSRSQEAWERFFKLFTIEPLRLTYEQIIADPEEATARVACYCGLKWVGEELVQQIGGAPLSPQTTPLNSEWERRFRSEEADLKTAALVAPRILCGQPTSFPEYS